jgi:colanic acid/amylovoran biosynthesis protein
MAEHRGERILITNYFSAANRGDAAILEGMLYGLRTTFPDASFVVHSSYPDLVPLVHGVEARYDLCKWMPRPISRASAAYLTMWARAKRRGAELPVPHKALRESLHDYEKADIVVPKGGGYLHDYYDDCEPRLLSLRVATILGKTVCLGAQSIGPLKERGMRRIARSVLKDVDLIIVRDSSSFEVLQDLKLNGPRIEQTADAAFAMPRKPDDYSSFPRWETTPDVNGVDDTERRLTLSVRHLPDLSREEEERYIESFAALADWSEEDLDRRSLFLSTCTSLGGYHNDDRLFAARVAERCESAPEIASFDYDPYEIVNLIAGHSILHVGTRMHSNVLALMAGVPIVGIAYEPKIAGLAEALGVEDYVLDIKEITPDAIIDRVQHAFERRQELADQIAEKLPGAQKSAMDNARLIYDVHEGRQQRTS